MQGSRFPKYLALFLIPLIAACTATPTSETPHAHSPPIDNCAVGCPIGGGALTLTRYAYTLNNNSSTKFANWVAYKVTPSSSAMNRPRVWKTDPDIPPGETLAPADYTGANAALKIDRGHQANLASMGGVFDWQSLNYLSNITPQKSDLNQGAWARLEDQERGLSRDPAVDEVHVMTGPLYEQFVGVLPRTDKQHTIPSGYWKIIFIGRSPEQGLYASFVMNQDTPRGASFCDYQVTVAQIEQRSGLTFWGGLPLVAQATLKTTGGQLAERMGCD
ncbi:DNA/RNA non-specific endonuclease [Pseudomonas sp. LB3P31]